MNSNNLRQRSYPCNAGLLVKLRQQKKWTQSQLALEAGYSVRLIAKAEAGHPISLDTIEILAEALSSPQQMISPEDLMCSPVQLAREFMAVMYRHGKDTVDHILHFLDPDPEFHVAGDPDIVPFAGIYRGIPEVRRLFGLFFSVMEVPADHDPFPELHFVGNETDVVVWGMSWLHPVGRPLVSPMPISHLLRFRQGKLYFLEDRFDVAEASKLFTTGPCLS